MYFEEVALEYEDCIFLALNGNWFGTVLNTLINPALVPWGLCDPSPL